MFDESSETETPSETIEPQWAGAMRTFFSSDHHLFSALKMKPTQGDRDFVAVEATIPEHFSFRKDDRQAHGGVCAIILDTVFGLAVFARLKTLKPIATINLKTDYLAPIEIGASVACRAQCHAISGSIARLRGEILDKDEKSLATATGAFMIGSGGPNFGSLVNSAFVNTAPVMTGGANSRLARWLGFDVSESDGTRVYSLSPNDRHVGNPLIKALHGGVVSTFLECAAHHELQRTLTPNEVGDAININIDYLKPVKFSPLFAKARIARAGRRLAFVDCIAWQDDEENPVAKAACSFNASNSAKTSLVSAKLAPGGDSGGFSGHEGSLEKIL